MNEVDLTVLDELGDQRGNVAQAVLVGQAAKVLAVEAGLARGGAEVALVAREEIGDAVRLTRGGAIVNERLKA